MCINTQKSSLILEGFTRVEIRRISEDLPFETQRMTNNFKYLGFQLNLNIDRIQDWYWFVVKTENRAKQWSYKWLSIEGRFVLIKSILMVILVYWNTLTWVPKGILARVRKVCSRFLWVGSKEDLVLP